ncbi:MAG: uracil-DNA glycosylase [Yoonia sp.]|nr:uracil-DNA glycosylase [Yoonia sp.]
MESVDTYWSDRAALEWQVEMGATEAILDAPLNRYEVPEKLAKPVIAQKPKGPPPIPVPVAVDGVAEAKAAAAGAAGLDGLQAALNAFQHCDLKKGARKMIFGEGDPASRVMIVGEAPTTLEDRAGQPFVGDMRTLLDNMFAAIDMGVAHDNAAQRIYLTAAFPWSAGNVAPTLTDIQMITPFLERHIALANPDVVVLMGNTACQMLLGKTGVSRLRGTWSEVMGRPALAMNHPAQLIRDPSGKRDAWADLLALKAKLES